MVKGFQTRPKSLASVEVINVIVAIPLHNE
jgi:hypothetical protein